jgi:hypothetical protein
MTFNAAGQISKFGFHATEFGSRAAASFGCRRRCCALSTQTFALGFRSASRFGKQSGGGCYRFSGGKPSGLRFLRINDSARPAPLYFSTFLLDSRTLVSNHTHVAFSTLYFVGQSGCR